MRHQIRIPSSLAMSLGMSVGLWLGMLHPADAAEKLVLTADQSQIIQLPSDPGTVVVGNPSIADATLEGRSIFLHARGPGLTNILVLDAAGKAMVDYQVHVAYADSDSIAKFTPAGRFTYTCPTDCEPTLRVGDNDQFFKGFIDQLNSKTALATSQALGEDLLLSRTPAPSAP